MAAEKHYACVTTAEFPQLLKDMEAHQCDLITKAAMHLLALTFVRTGELIGAKWAEIFWDREEWHIPKERMKMRRPHVVPLSKQVLAILKDLHKQTGKNLMFFIALPQIKAYQQRGCTHGTTPRMGYQGKMTGHGYRSLASTILNEKGYAPM